MASSSKTDDIVSRLFARSPVPPLEPGKTVYDVGLTKEIEQCGEHKYVIAAMHLANDDIENCHLIAQDNEGDATADLLHATLHRREDAKSFVDACEKQAGSNSPAEMKLRERQWEDLKGLVSWTRENCR